MTSALAAAMTQQTQSERMSENRELIQAVRALNGAEVFGQSQELQFMLDRETRRPVVKMVDRKTGEVVAQIPSESVLRLARKLTATM
ncbi:MAG: flagellar protein FlaG [Bryobacterales bacterium]|nr:flagellar protein FlaG [Bryobacterales bacterium]